MAWQQQVFDFVHNNWKAVAGFFSGIAAEEIRSYIKAKRESKKPGTQGELAKAEHNYRIRTEIEAKAQKIDRTLNDYRKVQIEFLRLHTLLRHDEGCVMASRPPDFVNTHEPAIHATVKQIDSIALQDAEHWLQVFQECRILVRMEDVKNTLEAILKHIKQQMDMIEWLREPSIKKLREKLIE